MYACCVCGERVLPRSFLCTRCLQQYALAGVGLRDWPAWIRGARKAERRRRYVDELQPIGADGPILTGNLHTYGRPVVRDETIWLSHGCERPTESHAFGLLKGDKGWINRLRNRVREYHGVRGIDGRLYVGHVKGRSATYKWWIFVEKVLGPNNEETGEKSGLRLLEGKRANLRFIAPIFNSQRYFRRVGEW